MKIRITLKDPDGVGNSLDEAAVADIPKDLTEDEKEAVYGLRREKIAGAMEKWVECGEYVSIEIDTEAGTAIVLPATR